MNTISIDDLAAPVFSEQGRKILEQRAAIPIEFTFDGIVAYAEKMSDVPLYKEGTLFHRLESFIMEGDKHCRYTTAGKKYLAVGFASALVQRSRMEALFDRHPEIADIEVEAPIIITGLPRSGTTNLSNIMASDSRLNSLSFWEASQPIPSLNEMNGEIVAEENRAELWRQSLENLYTIVPYFKNMIDVPYDGAMEELMLMHMAGMPAGNMNHAYTPQWNSWFWGEMDPMDMYAQVKRCIQALDWLRGNKKRWVLKSPHHLAFLSSVDKAFPDANYIITHRDPASSAISNATMVAYLYRECYEKPDPKAACEIALQMNHGMAKGLVRDIDSMDASRITHVYFHEYMADVMGTLEHIYHSINAPWTESAQQELRGYIESHPRGRHGGKLTYNPERDFGLTRQQIRDQFQYYIDRFPVKIEDKHG